MLLLNFFSTLLGNSIFHDKWTNYMLIIIKSLCVVHCRHYIDESIKVLELEESLTEANSSVDDLIQTLKVKLVWFMVFNATFNNISVISWWSVLFVEETGENHRPVTSYWQTLSYNVVSSTPRHERGFELTNLVVIGTDYINGKVLHL